MRKILSHLCVLGVCALPLVACETDEPGSDATTESDTTTSTPDTEVEAPKYFAVIIDDSVQFPEHRSDGGDPCATSSSNAHGADIDAVELLDGNTSLGYFAVTNYQTGDFCDDTAFTDPNEAEGAPDPATLSDGFVSLAGGSITGEFDDSVEVLEGYTIQVYEVDDDTPGCGAGCVGSEGYSVWVATDLDCTIASTGACAPIEIADDGFGSGTFDVPAL